MAKAAGGTGAKSVATAAGMTTGVTGGEAWDPVVAAARVGGIGSKPRCC